MKKSFFLSISGSFPELKKLHFDRNNEQFRIDLFLTIEAKDIKITRPGTKLAVNKLSTCLNLLKVNLLGKNPNLL